MIVGVDKNVDFFYLFFLFIFYFNFFGVCYGCNINFFVENFLYWLCVLGNIFIQFNFVQFCLSYERVKCFF